MHLTSNLRGIFTLLAAVTSLSIGSSESLAPAAGASQPAPAAEVRQIVTFLFQPGRVADALAIYEKRLLPIYQDVAPLRRFRAYREAESPEPLDLVIVSSYDGMAGMDAANDALRQPRRAGASAFQLYGELSAMTTAHHDQFVEMLPGLGDAAVDRGGLTVFEYVRVSPGATAAYERLLQERVRPFETGRALYQWSETGRMIVADGWDYLRLFGVRSLADWHTYATEMRQAEFQPTLAPLVAARKTLILRHDVGLSVR